MKSLVQFINESILKSNHRICENADDDPCFKFLQQLRLKECKKLNIDPEDYDAQIIDHGDNNMLAICNSVQTFPFAYLDITNDSKIKNVNDKLIKDTDDDVTMDNMDDIFNVIEGLAHHVVVVFSQSKQTMLCFNQGLIEVIDKKNAYYSDYTKTKTPWIDKFLEGESIKIKLPSSSKSVNASDLITYGDLVKILFELSDQKVKRLSNILNSKDTTIYILYRD